MVCGILKYPCFNYNKKKNPQTNSDKKETAS